MRADVRKGAVFETFEVTSPPEEYVSGVLKNPKRLASKYFYDDRGSRLFEEICGLKEYYPARAERSILEKESRAIAKRIGRGAALVELGSGTGEKGRILLERLDEPAVYLPLEISAEQLKRSVDEARLIGGGIEIVPLCLDYTERLELPSNVENAEMVFVFFPGSTIGNFE